MSIRAEVYSLRLPGSLLRKIRAIAHARNIAPSQQVRRWIEEGVGARSPSQVSEAVMPYHAATEETAPQPAIGPAIRSAIRAAIAVVAPNVARACARRGVRTLTLFGSFATGDARPDSDVDFCVDFEPMEPAARANAYFGLSADLERITGRTVDLVEREAVLNPFVRASLDKTEIVLYESP